MLIVSFLINLFFTLNPFLNWVDFQYSPFLVGLKRLKNHYYFEYLLVNNI